MPGLTRRQLAAVAIGAAAAAVNVKPEYVKITVRARAINPKHPAASLLIEFGVRIRKAEGPDGFRIAVVNLKDAVLNVVRQHDAVLVGLPIFRAETA